ncbi:MAG: hypothetical protein HPY81_09615 [Firmicutes bacterium]|nr:hypothetical protein [Bacillota bacterium]
MADTDPLYQAYRLLVLDKHVYDLPVYVVWTRHHLPFASELWWFATQYLLAPGFTCQVG